MIAIQKGDTAPQLSADLKGALTGDLRRWQVRTVIVGPMYNQAAMIDFFRSLFGREPESVGGVLVWWDIQA